ncbi:MAG TPA: LamG domain-containing protein [Thermoanaerobaculia bacterium]|jgi:hypothetical protein
MRLFVPVLVALSLVLSGATSVTAQCTVFASPYIVTLGNDNPGSTGHSFMSQITLFSSSSCPNDVTFSITDYGPATGSLTGPTSLTLGPTSGLFTAQLTFYYTFPTPVLPFQGSVHIEDLSDSSRFTDITYTGMVVSSFGISDYVQMISGPSTGPATFSPVSGSPLPPSCHLQFCPIYYQAKFFDFDGSGTSVAHWNWKIELYHRKGTYVLLSNSMPGSTISNFALNSAFTLPSGYDWVRDANGNIVAKVSVTAMDSDGISHDAGQIVGINFPPGKTTGSLQCRDGAPIANSALTVQFRDSNGVLDSQATTSDSAGLFSVALQCSASSHQGEFFLITTPSCPTGWTIPATRCDVSLPPITCQECGACIPPPVGLVDWWTFDEPSGAIANDAAGTANKAVMFGNASPALGKVTRARCFDGSSGYATVANHSDIDFRGNCSADAAESFTIDFWIKTAVSGVAVILDKRKAAAGSLAGYSVFVYNGRLGFQMATGSGNANCNSAGSACTNYISPAGTPNVDLRDNRWHFAAIAVSRCRGGIGKMYVDGQLVYTFVPRAGRLSNPANLQIGRRDPAFGASYLKGCIDELEIFKRALPQTDILAIFNAGSGGKCRQATRNPRTP